MTAQDTSKMSNEDLQFHYFKVHDSDNDDKLDGIELASAMAHYHDEEAGEKPEDYTEEVRGIIYRTTEICRSKNARFFIRTLNSQKLAFERL